MVRYLKRIHKHAITTIAKLQPLQQHYHPKATFLLIFIIVNASINDITRMFLYRHVSFHNLPFQLMAAGERGATGVHVQHHVGKVENLGLDYVIVHPPNTEDQPAL